MKELSIHREEKFDFAHLFNNSEKINGNISPYLKDVRLAAADSFSKIGFPGKKDKKYKYLSVEILFEFNYNYRFIPEIIHFNINHVFNCDIPTLKTHMIFLLNGFYYGGDKQLSELPGGIIYGSMMKAMEDKPDIFRKYFSRSTEMDNDGLVNLNTALARDGFFIYVPDNTVLDKPIQVVNLILTNKELMIQPRNLVILGENAHIKLVICDHALSKKKSFTNSVTETFVGQNSRYDFTLIQNEHNDSSHINYHFINQEKGSRVDTNSISLHGGIIRNNHYVKLNGKGSENYSNGLYLTDKDQTIDNFIYVDHAFSNCRSEQLYKGVLDDRANGTFSGRILVRRDAQLTEAFQRNNNILLTEEARMNTKPQLEIYADDVKCSHGATVGQIDEEAMFYLQSRGISEKNARLMMMYGFAHEVINRIHIDALKDGIAELVYKRLRGELAKCDNCAIICS